jgi:hypothetical protein
MPEPLALLPKVLPPPERAPQIHQRQELPPRVPRSQSQILRQRVPELLPQVLEPRN